MHWYSENNRVLSRRPKLPVLSIGSCRLLLSELKAVKPATANAQPIRADTVMTMPGKWRCYRLAYLEYCRVPLTTGLHFVSHLHWQPWGWYFQCSLGIYKWQLFRPVVNQINTVCKWASRWHLIWPNIKLYITAQKILALFCHTLRIAVNQASKFWEKSGCCFKLCQTTQGCSVLAH